MGGGRANIHMWGAPTPIKAPRIRDALEEDKYKHGKRPIRFTPTSLEDPSDESITHTSRRRAVPTKVSKMRKLPRLSQKQLDALGQPLPQLPTSLSLEDQLDLMDNIYGRLCRCASEFVARWQLSIPTMQLPLPEVTSTRALLLYKWAEWVEQLKNIPELDQVLYNPTFRFGRIVYEDRTYEIRPALDHTQPFDSTMFTLSPDRIDDRSLLQLISAATRIAQLLKDPAAMKDFDRLYRGTEALIIWRTKAEEPKRRQSKWRQLVCCLG